MCSCVLIVHICSRVAAVLLVVSGNEYAVNFRSTQHSSLEKHSPPTTEWSPPPKMTLGQYDDEYPLRKTSMLLRWNDAFACLSCIPCCCLTPRFHYIKLQTRFSTGSRTFLVSDQVCDQLADVFGLKHVLSKIIEQGLTSNQTRYRSYRGRVFTGQMTQPTESQHWRKLGPKD